MHQYEARCVCGMTWRLYRDENEDDAFGTCVNCGRTTMDLVDIGEPRSAEPGTT